MSDVEIDFRRAAIVAAHPDDEILWFASLVTKVRHIILCYGSISKTSKRAAGRSRAIDAYPLHTVIFLDLPIPPAGIPETDDTAVRALAGRLAATLDGTSTVFTHNPWGEYGQPDHKRVYAAVGRLKETMKFGVYVSGYVARHQLPQLNEALGSAIDHLIFPVRFSEIRPIYHLYKAHDCWTWSPIWKWPAHEYFLQLNAPQHTKQLPVLLFGSRRKRRAEMRGFWAKIWNARTKQHVVSLAGDP